MRFAFHVPRLGRPMLCQPKQQRGGGLTFQLPPTHSKKKKKKAIDSTNNKPVLFIGRQRDANFFCVAVAAKSFSSESGGQRDLLH